MIYNPTPWVDHVMEHPNTYTMVSNPDGTKTLIPAGGAVVQQGTPMNASAFNNIENALLMAVMALRSVATDGVREFGENLQVIPDGGDMKVRVLPGGGLVNGYPFELTDEAVLTPDVPDADDRIDRVVVRVDANTNPVTRSLYLIKGDAAETPEAPELVRVGGIYDISLCQVYIGAEATELTKEEILDERADESVCGAVTPAALRLSVLGTLVNAAIGQAVDSESAPTFAGLNLTGPVNLNGQEIRNGVFG